MLRHKDKNRAFKLTRIYDIGGANTYIAKYVFL